MNLALAVGCGEYEDPDIHSLKYPDKDAQGAASILSANCAVGASELFLLMSGATGRLRSTRSNIIRALSHPTLLSSVPQIDLLFFFFSGHGARSQSTGQDYLLPCDSVFSSVDETAIPFATVIRYLEFWKARQTIIFVDACRSPLRAGKSIHISTEEVLQTQTLKFPGVAAFWACSPGERSYELDAEESGAFSHALRAGLGDQGKCKSIAELDRYLRENVPGLCRSHGLPPQNPYCDVRPLARQHSIIVSAIVCDRWESAAPIGREIRPHVAPFIDRSLDGPYYCGFDFGTSYSAVAVCDRHGKPVFIPSPQRRILVPSVVAFLPNLDYLVGWPALEYATVNRQAAVFHIKRKLGTQDSVVVHGRTFTPEFIASLIIRSLAKNLEDYLGGPIYRAIVSAPANFSIAQCNALTKAFELAGVPAFRFMSEPSAAALAAEYRSESRDRDRSYLIVDLGGGTLDVAVVVIEPVVVTLDRSIWEVVSVAGDRNLGGLDYDLAVQRYIESRVREKIRSVDYEFNEADTAQIRSESERVKIDLGTREETHVLLQNFECNAGLYDIDVPISRGLFRALVEDLNRRFLDCVNAALMAGIRFDTKQMDQVFLAGQGAKIFCVRELLEQRFPGVAFEDTFQENAVIYGMGRYSGVFTGIIKDRLLLEVTPFALCIRCREIVTDSSTAESRAEFFVSDDPVKNVLTTFILAPNTTIPTRKSVFGRFDAKPGMKVPLYIVERGLTDASETSVGLIELPVGVLLPEFELTIDIDADRTVKILVHNYSTGQAETYQVNNFFGELARTKKQGELVRLVGT